MIKKKMVQDILKINKIHRLKLIINSGKDQSCINRIEFLYLSYLMYKSVESPLKAKLFQLCIFSLPNLNCHLKNCISLYIIWRLSYF